MGSQHSRTKTSEYSSEPKAGRTEVGETGGIKPLGKALLVNLDQKTPAGKRVRRKRS